MEDHDLRQTGPRLRRLLVALAVAAAVGGLVAMVAWAVIDPEASTKAGDWRLGPWRALFFFTAAGGGSAFVATSALLKRRDRRRWMAGRGTRDG